jgi:hypothetical protein
MAVKKQEGPPPQRKIWRVKWMLERESGEVTPEVSGLMTRRAAEDAQRFWRDRHPMKLKGEVFADNEEWQKQLAKEKKS